MGRINSDIIKAKTKAFFTFFWSHIKRNARAMWSFLIAMLVLAVSSGLHFRNSPVFNIPLLGETIISGLFFLLVYFFGKLFVSSIGSWFENVVGKALLKILNEFWKVQSSRLVEAIKRENTTSKVETRDSMVQPIVLDTSTIIDGRILGVIETGFMSAPIIVPQNVIDELRHMADKSDALKRQKGRRGLDTLKTIRKTVGRKMFTVANLKTKPEDVDNSLVQYCKENKAKIATVDYNLNKAAQVSGVTVLNINKLANEIKTNLLPGEIMLVRLVQKGKEEGQAVAYLEDGTMLVVKDAVDSVGKHREVRVEKVLQTSAGRMIFAELMD